MGKHKHKKSKEYSSSSDESYKHKRKVNKKRHDSSSSENEIKTKKNKKKEKSRTYASSSSYSSDNSDIDTKVSRSNKSNYTHVKKLDTTDKMERDLWMSVKSSFRTISNVDSKEERAKQKRLDREKQQYNPRNCERELNPYWKHGGDGLPKFKKPSEDLEERYDKYNKSKSSGTSNWKKKESTREETKIENKPSSSKEVISQESEEKTCEYTEKDLNNLAAKLVKAEIIGNPKLIKELKEKLEYARNILKNKSNSEDVVLIETNSKGQSKPLRMQSEYEEISKTKKKKRTETHQGNERVRYFPDDDKFSLKEMFENEKFNTGADQDKEFLKSFGKVKKNDFLDDIFTDNIRNKEGSSKIDEKNRAKAINEHKKVSQSLHKCNKCLQSESMLKHLMISMNDTAYLALPSFQPLTKGHCMIIPIRHATCITQLDENEWSDIMDLRKSLVKMFLSENKTCIFFECAMNLHKFPHMVLECVPMDREEGDLAPIYFKKAIDESEIEWVQNKKLISLKGRDVRKAIPKGLSYFSVSFGIEEGFAHVIEDEQLFPINFAQEIIGGMLDLHHSKWRKPLNENFEEQSKRVMEFTSKWKNFDCTN